jgi:hypothetical protein
MRGTGKRALFSGRLGADLGTSVEPYVAMASRAAAVGSQCRAETSDHGAGVPYGQASAVLPKHHTHAHSLTTHQLLARHLNGSSRIAQSVPKHPPCLVHKYVNRRRPRAGGLSTTITRAAVAGCNMSVSALISNRESTWHVQWLTVVQPSGWSSRIKHHVFYRLPHPSHCQRLCSHRLSPVLAASI